jgi:hypothetical protein
VHAERLGAFADLHKEGLGTAAELRRKRQAVLKDAELGGEIKYPYGHWQN